MTTRKKHLVYTTVVLFILLLLFVQIARCARVDRASMTIPEPVQPQSQVTGGSGSTGSAGWQVQGVLEIDPDSLGSFTDTEIRASVVGKTCLYIDGNLFFALKLAVMEEIMYYMVNERGFNDTNEGDVFNAKIRTYRTSRGTPVNSILSLSAS